MASKVLAQALAKVQKSGKLRVRLGSAELSAIRASIRRRAVFSAKVEKAKILDGIRDITVDVLERRLNPLEARERLRSIIEGSKYRAPAGKEGSMQDLTSDQRIDLIVRTNRDMARGYGRYVEAQKSLDEYPFWELYRAEPRNDPRDWKSRWAEAGGRLIDGRMMAPVNSSIWLRISAFGNPYPPFDWNSGMSIRRVARKRVEGKARIPKQAPKNIASFDSVQADITKDKRLASQLLRDLGPGYAIKGGKVVGG